MHGHNQWRQRTNHPSRQRTLRPQGAKPLHGAGMRAEPFRPPMPTCFNCFFVIIPMQGAAACKSPMRGGIALLLSEPGRAPARERDAESIPDLNSSLKLLMLDHKTGRSAKDSSLTLKTDGGQQGTKPLHWAGTCAEPFRPPPPTSFDCFSHFPWKHRAC